jgi:hypothetical protein
MIKFICFCINIGTGFLKAAFLMSLWNWTVTPLGAPALGYWHAYLLGTLFSHVVYTSTWKFADANTNLSDEERLTWAVIKPMAVGMGFGVAWVTYLLTGPY